MNANVSLHEERIFVFPSPRFNDIEKDGKAENHRRRFWQPQNMYPFVKSLLWSLNILKQANVEIDSTRLSLKGSPNDESMRYSATFSTASSSPVKRVRRVLSCEIKKWKFPQNDASKYQFPMTQIFSAIDRSIRPRHNRRLVWHYSRNEVRLMRAFLATDFSRLFFLHPKLSAKEFESIRQ